MNCLRRLNRPMPTGGKNEEGRPQGQASWEHCSARLVTKPHASLLRLLDVQRALVDPEEFHRRYEAASD